MRTEPVTARSRRIRRRRAFFTSIALAGLLATTTVAEAAPSGDNGRPDHVLDRDRRGEDAIHALGDRLPAVAAQNGMTPGEFRRELREENALWVGRSGQLLFVDTELSGAGEGPESAPLAEAPLEDTFVLHSRPGSNRVIYLDFDGHDAAGTAWDNGGNTVAAPYSQDGDPSTFNDNERASIQSIWRRVAEDFAPFAVDVTTEDPGTAAINRSGLSDTQFGTRLVVTPTFIYACGCGGVAYVDVFDTTWNHSYYQPAWVFTGGVGNGAKNVAEAASHEIGHNLGLSHDGAATTGYYRGHGDWGPIMGVGYYEPITQWSRGEYATATELEDDVSIIASSGAPLMSDDHGNTAASATALVGPDASLDALISTATDVDAFSFTTTGGAVTVDATPGPTSPNLDIELTIRDGSGSIIAQVDPSSSASSGNDTSVGLDVSFGASLAAGTYTIEIDGVGYGDPLTNGYSDYGSLGRYTLTASFPIDGSPPPPAGNQAPTANAAVLGDSSGEAPYTVYVTADGSTDPEDDVLTYAWDEDGNTAFSDLRTTSRTFNVPGTYTLTVTVDDGDLSDSDSVLITVTEPAATPPSAPTGLAATPTASTVDLAWSDTSNDETGFEIERQRQHRNRWRATTTFTASADATNYTDSSVSSNTYRYRIRAVNDAGTSAWTAWVETTVTAGSDDGGSTGGGGGNGNKGKKK